MGSGRIDSHIYQHDIRASTMSGFLRLTIFALVAIFATTGSASAQQYFKDCAFNTGRSANMIIPAAIQPTVSGHPMAPGTEIAIFTSDGVCAGRVVWNDMNVAMTIWGDDILTVTKDGMAAGDTLQFYLWDPEQQKLFAGPDFVRTQLDDSRPYYRRDNTFVEGAIYRLASLSVDVRNIVSLVAPGDGAEVSEGELSLEWTPIEQSARYRVQLAKSSTFEQLLVDKEVEGESASVEVADGETYFWRVAAAGSGDDEAWSDTYSFTTKQSATAGDELIEGFTLGQNYPNPFNPSTAIPFRIEASGEVSLRVYNTLGQEVATLVDGFLPAGSHSARWEAGDLPSGTYLYRLVSGHHTQTRMLTFIK
jgi:hypothetical protein